MKIAEKDKISFAITGIDWPVYNKYFLAEVNGKQLIQGFTDSGIKKYNPLYRDGMLNLTLFREFVEVSENPKDILQFIKRYGLLWVDEESKPLGEENAVEDIVEELRLFKKVNMLYELMFKLKDNPNDQEALNTLNNVVEYKKWTLGPFKIKDEREKVFFHPVLPSDPEILSRPNMEGITRHKRAISTYLVHLTREKLEKGVFPSYHGIPAREDESLCFSVYPSLECKDLASVMWLQFYMVLQGKVRLKPCKNENCTRFIEEGRREYCGDSCKKAKNQRDRRKRRAWQEKKVKE